MQISQLLQRINVVEKLGEDPDVCGIAYDSRKVKPGYVFFCITGLSQDGHKFAASAVENGASYIVAQKKLDLDIPQAVVKNTRRALAFASAEFFGRPSDKMKMFGITGTNGKTTTAYMIKTVLETNGKKSGLIGTVSNMAGTEKIDAAMTTPESRELHELLSTMFEKGCTAVAMEVSSHALSQHRVDGIEFSVGIFTNLTQDHLDYHGSMEAYAVEKKKLFTACRAAAFNADDPYGEYMSEGFPGRKILYGVNSPADITASHISYHANSVEYTLGIFERKYEVKINIPGGFTVYNSLACVSACVLAGLKDEQILKGLKKIHTIPGRIELVPTGEADFSVILDYAHTPDGIENLLSSIREFAKGAIITVFGCGGDRDRAKRPKMGAAAGKYSDYCIVTSDNPRTEKPEEIISDIIPGMEESGCEYEIVVNRTDAIHRAIDCAKSGDVVVLAGKGHEPYQEINGVRYPFDEKGIVADYLKNR